MLLLNENPKSKKEDKVKKRRMKMKKIKLLSLVVFIVLGLFTTKSYAFYSALGGKLELEGVFFHQSILRAEDFQRDAQYVMGRSSGELRALYHLTTEPCQTAGMFDKIDLRAIFRGGYDNVYDFTNKWGHDGGYFSKSKESDLKTESEMREWYVDLFKGPLWLRLGKQQIVWGKSDFFRLLDIINPLDYSWHNFFEGYDDIRIPLRLISAQYAVGDVGIFRGLSVQAVVNPEDFKSTGLGQFGMPWAPAPPGFQFFPNYKHDKGAQAGGRIQAIAGPFSFTINDYYTYQQDPVFNLSKGALTYPRVNVVGGCIDYYDDFTKSVWRAEITYTPNKVMAVNFSSSNAGNLLSDHPSGTLKRDEIKYVIGWDRNTWIRCLNKKATCFLSAQAFLTHVLNFEPGLSNGGTLAATETIFTALWNSSYISGKLTPQVYWAYYLRGNSHAMGPSLNYLITDHWAVKAGANIVWAADKGTDLNFGSSMNNDEVYLKLSFTF